MAYKTTLINNRRYLGNKYRLLPFIRQVVDEHCNNVNVVADLFAGTGAVSSAFQDRIIITNDILYSNYISNYAWFSAHEYDEQKSGHYDAYRKGVEYDQHLDVGRNWKRPA